MKILVDTSVWSLMLNRRKATDHPASLLLQKLIQNSSAVHISGIIFQEILQGIRSKTHYLRIEKYLRNFPSLKANLEVHEKAAALFNISRRMGTASHTVDCLIAALALHYRCRLLTTDLDFQRMAKFTPLKLATYS